MSNKYFFTVIISICLFSLILFFMFSNNMGDGIAVNNVKITETSHSLERMKKRIDDIQLKQSEIMTILVSLSQKTDVNNKQDKNSVTDKFKDKNIKNITADELEQQSGIQDASFDVVAFTEQYHHNATFDDQLMMEVVDVEWTNEVSSRVDAALKNKMVSGTVVVKNECKLTLCKFEFKHNDTESAELFHQYFQKKLQWQGRLQSYSLVRQNGNIETELYLMRKK